MDKTKEKSIGTVFLKGEVTSMVAVKSEEHLLSLIEQSMGHSTAELVRNLLREKNEEYARDVTALEEECDRLFIANMHKLHVEPLDVRDVMAWEEIYTYLEKCADACEEIADTVESVVMKNS